MSKPVLDQQVVRGFALLRDPTFAPLVRYLRDVREFNAESLMGSDVHAIFKAQGAVGALDDLIDTIERAQILVEKLRVV